MARRVLLAAVLGALMLAPAAVAQDAGNGGAGVPPPPDPTGGADVLHTPEPTGGADTPPPPPPPVARVAEAPEAPAAPASKPAPEKRARAAQNGDKDVEADVPVPDEEQAAEPPPAAEPDRVLGLASTGFAVALLGFLGLVLGVAGMSLRRARARPRQL